MQAEQRQRPSYGKILAFGKFLYYSFRPSHILGRKRQTSCLFLYFQIWILISCL